VTGQKYLINVEKHNGIAPIKSLEVVTQGGHVGQEM
jgi:hypothetical protein